MSESFAEISFGEDKTVKATVENTVVYSHAGDNELYDHVFISLNEEQGAYIWAQIPPDNEQFLALAEAAVKSGVELHVNIQRVSKNDAKAFGRAAIRDIDTTPEWLPEV
jgi:hypothetical protein